MSFPPPGLVSGSLVYGRIKKGAKMLHSVIFFNAVTPVHIGAGGGVGFIDRQLIRERTTNLPYIPGSTIKGVLKDEYRPRLSSDALAAIFGPDAGEKHSSAIAFSDASLLCLPIRSLNGWFVWATAPLLLYRFWHTLEIAGLSGSFPKLKNLLEVNELRHTLGNVLINPTAQNRLSVLQGKIVLEEFPFGIITNDRVGEFANELASKVYPDNQSTGSRAVIRDEFCERLVILPQQAFDYFVSYAMEVVPNIKIDDSTGTSKEGLRYSEYLPSETVLYCLVGFEKPRVPDSANTGLNDEQAVKTNFLDNFPARIQIGADETKGKGFVELSYVDSVPTPGGENG